MPESSQLNKADRPTMGFYYPEGTLFSKGFPAGKATSQPRQEGTAGGGKGGAPISLIPGKHWPPLAAVHQLLSTLLVSTAGCRPWL